MSDNEEEVRVEEVLEQTDAANVDEKALFNVSRQLKQHKREIEQDENLLKNRVAHLRAELAKAEKKINDTKSRAEDIKSLKDRRRKNKLVRDKTATNILGTKSIQVQRIKKQIVDAKVQAEQRRKETEEKIKTDAAKFKELKARLKQDKAKEYAIKQKKVMDRVAEQKEIMLRKKKQKELELQRVDARRRNNTKAEIAKVQEENESLREKVVELEQEERDWIEKLRKTQNEQKAAFSQLEDALALKVGDD